MKYKEISKFPSMKKDVAFIVDKEIASKEIETVIKKAGGNLLADIEVFDVYEGANLGENKKSIAYSLTFLDSKKTLTDEEVMQAFNKVIENVEKKCGAELRGQKKYMRKRYAFRTIIQKLTNYVNCGKIKL